MVSFLSCTPNLTQLKFRRLIKQLSEALIPYSKQDVLGYHNSGGESQH